MFSALISTFVSGAFIFFSENAATGRNVSIAAITVKIGVKKKKKKKAPEKDPKTEDSTLEEAIRKRIARTNA